MKKVILNTLCISCFIMITAIAYAQDSGIIFKHYELDAALKQSEKENKFIFIDCYATWCGPCKMLSKEVFTKKEVGDYFNQHFICLKFDMEREGKDIRKQFEVSAYPTLLFIDYKGNVVEKVVGSRGPNELIEVAKKAIDPEKNMQALNLKYEQGIVNYDVIDNKLSNRLDPFKEELLDQYFASIKSTQWTNQESWELIRKYAPITSKYFNYLLINEEMFGALYRKKAVDAVILGKFMSYYRKRLSTSDKLDAVKYLKTFQNPLAVKAVLLVENTKFVNIVLEKPVKRDSWANLFLTSKKIIDGFGEGEKISLRNLAIAINKKKNNIPKICKSIKATNHQLAPLMVQYLRLFQAREILKDSVISNKAINIVLEIGNEILTDRQVELLEVNNFAWRMLINKNRAQFLTIAQKLSFLTLEDKKYYHHGTYGAICAQMNNFEEAIKHEEIALQMAKESQPNKRQYYIDTLEKFRNKQPLY